MGCDIHMYTERWDKRTEKWQSFDFWEMNPYYQEDPEDPEDAKWEKKFHTVEFDGDRWYDKFSILSYGVRGEPEGPYAAELGMPTDCHKELAEQYILEDCDAHSVNHITVTDFRKLVAQYRVLRGSDSPLQPMHEALNEHIQRKLKYKHLIDEQSMDEIRLVYWFDN